MSCGVGHPEPRSHIAVAVAWAAGYSSDSTPSLGTSICRRCGPKDQKKRCGPTKTKKKDQKEMKERKKAA